MSPSIRWTDKLEDYFASTGEKAHCLGWVHRRSEALYSKRRTLIDLPSIIGSGIIAFLNAGSVSIFGNMGASSVALGVGSLAVGIINTMGTYFSWAKRAEGHRVSAIHYAKLYRFLAVELSLPREERTNPFSLLKYVRDQYDRLAETSPMLPPEVVAEFQKRFADEKEISKPEEANGLEKIVIFREADERPPAVSRQRSAPVPPISPAGMIVNPMLKAAKSIALKSRDPKGAAEILAPAPAPLTRADLGEDVQVPVAPTALAASS